MVQVLKDPEGATVYFVTEDLYSSAMKCETMDEANRDWRQDSRGRAQPLAASVAISLLLLHKVSN